MKEYFLGRKAVKEQFLGRGDCARAFLGRGGCEKAFFGRGEAVKEQGGPQDEIADGLRHSALFVQPSDDNCGAQALCTP